LKPDSEIIEEDPICLHNHTKSMIVCDEVLPCSPKALWGLLFGDETSHIVPSPMDQSKKMSFFEWFLTKKRLATNYEKTTWLVGAKEEMETLAFDRAKKGDNRTLFFDMNFGLQTAGCKQVFSVKAVSPSSICLESKTTNSGIPFSSSYSTSTNTCIKEEYDLDHCRLIISYSVNFEKDCYSIIKNPVQNAIKSKMPEFYSDLIQELKLHFRLPVAETPLQISSATRPIEGEGTAALEKLSILNDEEASFRVPKWAVYFAIVGTIIWLVAVFAFYIRLNAVTSQMKELQKKLI
jgi:hypothetical protein